jgi:hypothetical protein
MAYNNFIPILCSTKYGIFTSKALREPLEASRTRFVSVLDFGNLACKLIVSYRSQPQDRARDSEAFKPQASSKIQLKSPRRLKIIAPRVLGPAQPFSISLLLPWAHCVIAATGAGTFDGNGEI